MHAVASIAPSGTGTVNASYTYDGNGNMLTGRGRTVSWTSFDMVSQITQGTNSVSFTYDSDHARLKQLSSDGSNKYYLNDPVSGAMAEKIVGASLSVTWNNYIMLGGEMVALQVTGAATQTRYFHKDHLGSIVALTDESGAVVERDSFDAWGQRRNASGEDDWAYPGQSITSQITRGYTGHEQLDSVGLVHMNGRIYEPVIGKMMSADPTVPNAFDGQAYNRYSYVSNNPLSLTDLSGFRPDYKDEPNPAGPHSDRSNMGKPKDSSGGGGDLTGDPRDRQTAWIEKGGPGGGGGGYVTAPRPAPAPSTTPSRSWFGRLWDKLWGKPTPNPAPPTPAKGQEPPSITGAAGTGAMDVTEEGIQQIEQHLESLGALDPEIAPENQAAIDRLRAGLRTKHDLNFYEHEMTEIELKATGMPQEDAHLETLKRQ